jgi:hypothetical protein
MAAADLAGFDALITVDQTCGTELSYGPSDQQGDRTAAQALLNAEEPGIWMIADFKSELGANGHHRGKRFKSCSNGASPRTTPLGVRRGGDKFAAA